LLRLYTTQANIKDEKSYVISTLIISISFASAEPTSMYIEDVAIKHSKNANMWIEIIPEFD